MSSNNVIDRKFVFTAVNPCNGKHYTQENALILCAKDKAILPALYAYQDACVELGCDEMSLESVDLLIERVEMFQASNDCKIPDTNTECEIDRCIGGNLE